MSTTPEDFTTILPAAIERAENWVAITGDAASRKEATSTEQLAGLVQDPQGVDFTMGFVDRVARPEDNAVAAKELRQLANPFAGESQVPAFVGGIDKLLVGAGAITGPLLPNLVMPLARMRLRQMVGHLVLDAEGKALDALLDKAKEDGFVLNINLLGEAVLGEEEARRRLARTMDLLANEKVEYVSIKASSVVAQLNHYDPDGSIERLKDRLRPLYRQALQRTHQPFINMDMEEYKDLHLTIRLFTELLGEEEFRSLPAGIVLQAYLPDTYAALTELLEFGHARVAAGGAPIKIRLVKGANLSMERVDAEIHDWPQAPYLTKHEVDANYFRLLDEVLRPEHAAAVRIGVASHNLYSVAAAVELAQLRGVQDQLDIEMLQGMAPAQARAVKKAVDRVILYTPVVHREDFDVAVSYLVRRLEENGASQNFLHALFAKDVPRPDGLTPMEAQRLRFEQAVADRYDVFAGPRRTQNRLGEDTGAREVGAAGHFVGEPDTDPSLPANQQWAAQWLATDPGPVTSEVITDTAVVDAAMATATQAAAAWQQRTGAERAEVLDQLAEAFYHNRGRLISVATHEAGKTVAETDPEVSELIDFCRYYAESARTLDRHRGAQFTPHNVVVVTPPWNFPLAIPFGGCVAALAAGAAAIIKPAPQVVRCAEVMLEIAREAGLDESLLQLLNTDEAEAGKHLIAHPEVDSVILTGASETAELFRSWKPQMKINAETSGKNAIIVTPSADPDLAVADVYRSAFGHAGQKCSAASLLILVGSAGTSQRIRTQLVDAVKTLTVGVGTDISTTMNGIIEAPGEKLCRGLTQLEPGERWLLKPEALNAEETLWTPGIRDNVAPGSWYHTHECFGPVLGIMYAKDLDEAIAWQNATGFGLTGGLHSLDEEEIDYWRERVEVGNAYINRGITGAIVQRQSFGGWKASSLGTGAKAGGPNYVAQQGTWTQGDLNELPSATLSVAISTLLRQFMTTLDAGLDASDNFFLRRAAESDAFAWATEFSQEHDPTALISESNVFRYRPLLQPLQIRVGRDTAVRDILRLLLAAEITGTQVELSADPAVAESFGQFGGRLRPVSDAAFAQEVARSSAQRIRALGQVDPALYEAVIPGGSVVIDGEVLADGRRELLTFLLEQAVSTTKHRFGYIKGLNI